MLNGFDGKGDYMDEKKKERLLYWDILKGIGIISIVFGHSQNLGIVIRTVYYYHIVLFFFVAGYLYNEERYGDRPFEFFAGRLRNMWVPYLCYGGIFVLLHNQFSRHLLYPAIEYSKKDMIFAMVNTAFFQCSEGPSGALWFVPVMLAAGTGFTVILWFCRNYLPSSIRAWGSAVLCIGAGLFGMAVNRRGIYLNYHIQTAFLVIPVYYGGYLLRKRNISIENHTRWYGAAACAGFFCYFLVFTKESVELSVNVIPGGINFYLISAAGIYLCCFAAKCLERIPGAGRILPLAGRYSFDIMALHFLVFKIIDWIYVRLICGPLEILGNFPYSFPELHVIYLVCGVVLPVLPAMGARKAIHGLGRVVRTWAGSQEK